MTPDISCETCQDTLPWYVANSLSSGERSAMERHLASCERCLAALEEWRQVATAMRRADERIPLDTASVATWAHISHRLVEQTEFAYKVNERATMGLQDKSVPSASAPTGVFPAARLRTRVHSFISLAAAVAIIVLSAGVFALFSTRGSGHGSGLTATFHPTCAPSQATANLPAHTRLTAIAPLGTDDGWAVGGVSDPQQPTSLPSTLILHLQNCHWTPVGTPISKAALNDISMVSSDEGWAVGDMVTLDTTPMSNGQPRNFWEVSRPLVLHYTHGSWQQVDVPAEKANAEKVKMVSAGEGWMLLYGGKSLITVDGANSLAFGYALLHYQHGTWTNLPIGFWKPQMGVTDLDARQPGEVWLAGFDNSSGSTQPFVAHYTGGAWTRYDGAAMDVKTLSELSPTDVWAGGSQGLYHFDGTRWSKASVQGTRQIPGDKFARNSPLSIGQIVMTSPTQGWAFPDFGDWSMYQSQGTKNEVLRYDRGVWKWTTLQIQGATASMFISDFASSASAQGWAIGVRMLPDNEHVTEQTTVLLYYDAGAWSVVRQQP